MSVFRIVYVLLDNIMFGKKGGVTEMAEQSLGLHETMELHELLTFKTVCMTKSKTMQAIVTDDELKSLMQRDVDQSKKAISAMQGYLKEAPLQ